MPVLVTSEYNYYDNNFSHLASDPRVHCYHQAPRGGVAMPDTQTRNTKSNYTIVCGLSVALATSLPFQRGTHDVGHSVGVNTQNRATANNTK